MHKRPFTEQERIEAFKNKIIKIPFHECWEWGGFIEKNGYGVFSHKAYGKGSHFAHRYSFKIFNGPLDPNLVIDHICRNRSCVNPRHLRQVTAKVNTLENSMSVGALNAQKTHCIHGHEYTEENTVRVKNGKHCYICRRKTNNEAKRRWYSNRHAGYKNISSA